MPAPPLTSSARKKAAYAAKLARKFKSPSYSVAVSPDGRSVQVTLVLPKSVRRPRAPF